MPTTVNSPKDVSLNGLLELVFSLRLTVSLGVNKPVELTKVTVGTLQTNVSPLKWLG
jgi:hypothetical protein